MKNMRLFVPGLKKAFKPIFIRFDQRKSIMWNSNLLSGLKNFSISNPEYPTVEKELFTNRDKLKILIQQIKEELK